MELDAWEYEEDLEVGAGCDQNTLCGKKIIFLIKKILVTQKFNCLDPEF